MDDCFDVIESRSEDKDEFAVVVDQVLHAVQTLNKLAGGPAFQQEPFNSLPANSQVVDHLAASASSLGGQFVHQGKSLCTDMSNSTADEAGVDSVATEFAGFQALNPAAGSEAMEEHANGESEAEEDMEVDTQNQEDVPQESLEPEDEAGGNAAFVQEENEESTHASGVGEQQSAEDEDQQTIDAEDKSEVDAVSELEPNRTAEQTEEENVGTGNDHDYSALLESEDKGDDTEVEEEQREKEDNETEPGDAGEEVDNGKDAGEEKDDEIDNREEDLETGDVEERKNEDSAGAGEIPEQKMEGENQPEPEQKMEVENQAEQNKDEEEPEEIDSLAKVKDKYQSETMDEVGEDSVQGDKNISAGNEENMSETGEKVVETEGKANVDKGTEEIAEDHDKEKELEQGEQEKDTQEGDKEMVDQSKTDKDKTKTGDHSEKDTDRKATGRPRRKRKRAGSDHDYSALFESEDKDDDTEVEEEQQEKKDNEKEIGDAGEKVDNGKDAEEEEDTSFGDEATAPADISATSYGYEEVEDRMLEQPVDREVDVQDYQTPKGKKSNARGVERTPVQKVDDYMSELFQLPAELGWHREIVIRSVTDEQKSGVKNSKKIPADVYYYTPTKKKLRSKKEIQSHLHHMNTELTIDNFTFYKLPVYRGEGETIRLAKAQKGRSHSQTDLANLLRQYNSPAGTRVLSKLSNSRATPSPKMQELPAAPSPVPAAPSPAAPSPVQVTEAKPMKAVTQTVTHHRPRIIYTPQRFQAGTSKARGPVARKRMGGVVGKKQLATASAESLSTDGQVITTLRKETEHSPPPKKIKIGPRFVKLGLSKDSVLGAVKLCGLNCPGVEGIPPDLHCGVCMCLFHPQCVQFTGCTRPALFVCLSCRTRVGKKNIEAETSTAGVPATTMASITVKVVNNREGETNQGVISTTTPVITAMSAPPMNTINVDPSMIGDVVSRTLNEVSSVPGTAGAAVTMTSSLLQKPPIMIPAPTLPINRPIPSTAPTLIAAPGVVVTRTATQPSGSPVVMNTLSLSTTSGAGITSTSMSKPAQAKQPGIVPVSGQLLTLPDSISQKIDMKQPLQLKLNNQSVILPPSCLLATSGGVKVFLPPGTVAMQNGGSGANSASKDSAKTGKPAKGQETPGSNNSTIINHLQDNSEQTKAQTEVGTTTLNSMVSDAIQTVLRSSRTRRINPVMCHFQKLHVGFDCMLHIFGYLNVADLLKASRVCRTWRDVASQHWMWKVVRLRGSRVADWEGAARHFNRYSTVRLDMRGMLHFEDRNRTWHQFTAVLDQLKLLRHIDFGQSPATILHQAADKLIELKVLTAEWITDMSTEPNMWTTNVKLDVAKFANLKHLEELKLRGVCGLILPAFSFSGGLSDLSCLKLRSLSLTTLRDIPDHEFSFLESLTQLEFLELGDCTTFTVQTYSQLKELTKLKHLRLECGGEIPDNGLGDAVSNLTQLEQLELINFTIPPSLIDAFRELKNLHTVSVWPSMATHSAQVNTNTYKAMITISHLKQLDWGIMADNNSDQQEESDSDKTNTTQEKLDSIPFLPESSEVESENTNSDVDLLTEFIGINQLVEKLSASLPDTKIRVFRVPMFSAGKAK